MGHVKMSMGMEIRPSREAYTQQESLHACDI